jgi:hypothetical protein
MRIRKLMTKAAEAAAIRRHLAVVWRHRRALVSATAIAVPLLWAMTGHRSEPRSRSATGRPARKWTRFILLRRRR